MKVEVVYATAEGAHSEELELPEGTTVQAAVAASRFATTPVAVTAIFGKVVSAERMLEDGDRIELLRELLINPKDARRRRAQTP
ncbi:MAG: RnfH family protein [Gammaproteobacteria bacterium]|nr:RnfH family protein [Gammaproteobacteria bacterium]